MKTIAITMMLVGFGMLAWTIIDKLSTDAIGMAIGMGFGVLAGVPTATLVLLARRRASEDDYIDVQPTYQAPTTCEYTPVVYANQVTPYMHVFRKVTGMPPLPTRPAPPPPADIDAQIEELEPYLAHLKAQRASRRAPRPG